MASAAVKPAEAVRAPECDQEDGAPGGLHEAMRRAGRLLEARPRATEELKARLGAAGFEPEVVGRVVGRLRELGLLDDLAFARQWVQERARKGRAASLLEHELAAKGIAGDVAVAAIREAGLDEAAQARELAGRYLPRVASQPLPKQAARLTQMLLRRGYGHDVVEGAVRAVLPPEGWD
ncbi:MAG: regulatory protein RecX [Actinomycetota bacterium]